MSRFFPARHARGNLLLLGLCNLLFLAWLRHVGHLHEAMFFLTCTAVTNTLTLYSNRNADAPDAARNNLVANLGPILLSFGRVQIVRYMASCFARTEAPAGSQWGNLFALAGAVLMITTFANAGGDVISDGIMLILDPREENRTGAEKFRRFLLGTVKTSLVVGLFACLFLYWKGKGVENQDANIREKIAQADRDIATCDENVRLSLEMGYGNENQWREQSARYTEYKRKLESELSTAKPAQKPEAARDLVQTLPQPTNLTSHPFGPRVN
jgi:hypothetical protein